MLWLELCTPYGYWTRNTRHVCSGWLSWTNKRRTHWIHGTTWWTWTDLNKKQQWYLHRLNDISISIPDNTLSIQSPLNLPNLVRHLQLMPFLQAFNTVSCYTAIIFMHATSFSGQCNGQLWSSHQPNKPYVHKNSLYLYSLFF